MSRVIKIRNGNNIIDLLTGDEIKQITSYKIECKKQKSHILTREQLECIYRHYPKYGGNMTAAEISRQFFPHISDRVMTAIIQALRDNLGLSKSDTCFAPHEYEELSDLERGDLLKSFTLNFQKLKDKNNTVKVLQNVINTQHETIIKQEDLKSTIEALIKKENIEPYIIKNIKSNDKSLAVYLSDMHIGCRVDKDKAIMGENVNWDNDQVLQRLNKLLYRIKELGHFEEIWIFNLGDAIDGVGGTTTRNDVILPQNMSSTEMIDYYIQDLKYLFDSMIANNMANKYYFRSVSDSNHGGMAEYAASLVIAEYLNQKGVNAYVCNKIFGICRIQDSAVIYGHGKESKDQKAPLAVTLNAKTEKYISSFIDNCGLDKQLLPILFVKGDSHQSSLTATDKFEYKSVGSLFGSSMWAQTNFPTRKWQIDYSIFDGTSRLDGCIKDDKQHVKTIFK